MATVIFVHGMGTKVVDDAERYLHLLRSLTPHNYLLLLYGDILEKIPAYIVNWQPDEAVPQWDTLQDAYIDGYIDGYIANLLGLGDAEHLMPAGGVGEAGVFLRNLYLHATRYVLGRKVYRSVRDTIKQRFINLYDQYQFEPKSLVLLGYSLGSVVSLDILHDADICHLFSHFISVGSPLGVLGLVPRVPFADINVLSAERRSIQVNWTDVATRNDLIAFRRIADVPNFRSQGQPITPVTLPNWEKNISKTSSMTEGTSSHTCYFFDKSFAQQWLKYIKI